MTRAQVSFEFVLLVATMLVVLVVYMIFASERILFAKEERFHALFQDTIKGTRTEFLMAAGMSDGYSRNFEVPQLMDGTAYTIQNANNTLWANTSKFVVSYKIPSVNGTIQKGTNTLRKSGGALYLN